MFCYGKTLFGKSDKVAELTFFWGGFSAFMVYALTLISVAYYFLVFCKVFPYKTQGSNMRKYFSYKK